MEHVGRVPMSLLHSPLDQSGEAVVSRGAVWAETMASLVAVIAGRDDIWSMLASILLSNEMLARSLETRCLA